MNRYVLDGLLATVRTGKRVLLVSETLAAGRDAFDQMTAEPRLGEEVRRSNGHELLTAVAGGRMEFASLGSLSRLRGRSYDHVFIDCDLDVTDFGLHVQPVLADGGTAMLR